jgi:GT2 family glycosyltransferase
LMTAPMSDTGAKDRISILIPLYNSRRYIASTIEAALAQCWKPVEIIVVDDGSTDGSHQIAERYQQRGVRLIRQKNAGAAAARNRAFVASGGRHVLFLDADDLISPNHLTALHRAIADAPGCIAMSTWDRFVVDPSEAQFPSRPSYRDANSVDWLTAEWRHATPMMQAGMFLIPRQVIEKAGCWHEGLSLIDDFEFFARIILAAGGIRFGPEARLYYRSNIPGSLSSRRSRASVESAFLSICLGTSYLLAAEDSARTRRASANMLQNFEYTYYPYHPDLRAKARERVAQLGGSDLSPDGPPAFHRLRTLIGWRNARLLQRASTAIKQGLRAPTR